MHRVTVREGVDDERCYASGAGRLLGPFDDKATAARAVNTAAARVAIRYAGLECTAAEALDETFGAGGDPDERDRRSDLYYNAALNLMDGAERSVMDQMADDDPELQQCHDWRCHVCGDEWTGPDRSCWNCESRNGADPQRED